MAFCFDVATADAGRGCRLEIEEVAGGSLPHCGIESPQDLRLCPCGSADVDVVAGEELTVASSSCVKEPSCA